MLKQYFVLRVVLYYYNAQSAVVFGLNMPKENKMCLTVRTVMALISTHIGTRYQQVLKGKYLYLV